MAGFRLERVAAEMQKNLSVIINQELKNIDLKALVTVTKIEVSKDIKHANVYISLLGSKDACAETFGSLCDSTSIMRRLLAQKMKSMHCVPELHLFCDNNAEYSQHISNILKSL